LSALRDQDLSREQLEAHLDRHQLKDLYLEGELKGFSTPWEECDSSSNFTADCGEVKVSRAQT